MGAGNSKFPGLFPIKKGNIERIGGRPLALSRMSKPLSFLMMWVLGSLLLSGFSCKSVPVATGPTAGLRVHGHAMTVEIADRAITRETGLMFRREMDPDHGMIFVFPDLAQRYFWMKNTYIPLSIAFLDEKGVVLNVLEMPPLTESSFPSRGPAKYAIEMNERWFEKAGVKAGDKVEGLEVLSRPLD